MHLIFFFIAALLSTIALASAAGDMSPPEREEALKALVAQVRKDQMWPPRPHRIYCPQYTVPDKELSQSPILPDIDASHPSGLINSDTKHVDSILAAVAPESKLAKVRKARDMFAQPTLHERSRYEDLPAAIKEYADIQQIRDPRKARTSEPLATPGRDIDEEQTETG